MLERPFGAMNGCLGTSWPLVGSGVAAEPMKVGTLASGPCGIGSGLSPGICAWAALGAVSAASSRQCDHSMRASSYACSLAPRRPAGAD